MQVSLIIIGDELLSGKVQDTNGQWLARQLFLRGLSLRQISTVNDDEKGLTEALAHCWKDSDMVITTGGIGPTPDDRTKQILSHFFDAPLEHNPMAEKMTNKHYAHRNRLRPPENDYSQLPRNFVPLFNPCGLAPGLLFRKDNKILASLPGVPREMKMMAEKELFPQLKTTEVPYVFTIRTRGVTEEDIFLKLCPGLWEQLSTFGKVASLPHNTGIDLHITLTARNSDQLKNLLNESPLQKYIWQFGNLSLPVLILKKMKEKKLTLAMAESATGGLMSSLITDAPGASNNFLGSTIAYNNSIKKNILGVPEEYLHSEGGPVNKATAQAMARGAQNVFESDIAIAITGQAGPPVPNDTRPVGTVAIGTASKGSTEAFEYQFTGNREQLKERFALTGLFALLKLIETF